MEYVADFNKWALEQFEEMKNRKIFTMFVVDNKTTGVMNTKTKEIALSHCRPSDKCDRRIGAGVAYARLMKREIPKGLKRVPIGTLKTGAKFKKYASVNDKRINYILGRDFENNELIYCITYYDNNTIKCTLLNENNFVYVIE